MPVLTVSVWMRLTVSFRKIEFGRDLSQKIKFLSLWVTQLDRIRRMVWWGVTGGVHFFGGPNNAVSDFHFGSFQGV